MFKFSLFLLLLLTATAAVAQPVMSDVIKVDSVSAEKLFSNGKKAFTKIFKSSKGAIDLTDEQGKTIVANGAFDVNAIGFAVRKSTVFFRLSFEARDGRYKYEFSDIIFHYQAGSLTPEIKTPITEETCKGITKKQWQKVKDQTYTTIGEIIADLKKEIATSENW